MPASEAEYLERVKYCDLIHRCARILECEQSEFQRMLDGLIDSIELMRRVKEGGEISADEVRRLPKRYRKPLKPFARGR